MRSIRCILLSVLMLSSFAAQSFAYYHPDEGRWISRDPIQEIGGINLYSFVSNDSVGLVDLYGLEECNACCLGSDMVNIRVRWASPSGPYRYGLAANTTYAIIDSWIGSNDAVCHKDIKFIWQDCVHRMDEPGSESWQEDFSPRDYNQWAVYVYSKIKWKSCEKGNWVEKERGSENSVGWVYVPATDTYKRDRDIPR